MKKENDVASLIVSSPNEKVQNEIFEKMLYLQDRNKAESAEVWLESVAKKSLPFFIETVFLISRLSEKPNKNSKISELLVNQIDKNFNMFDWVKVLSFAISNWGSYFDKNIDNFEKASKTLYEIAVWLSSKKYYRLSILLMEFLQQKCPVEIFSEIGIEEKVIENYFNETRRKMFDSSMRKLELEDNFMQYQAGLQDDAGWIIFLCEMHVMDLQLQDCFDMERVDKALEITVEKIESHVLYVTLGEEFADFFSEKYLIPRFKSKNPQLILCETVIERSSVEGFDFLMRCGAHKKIVCSNEHVIDTSKTLIGSLFDFFSTAEIGKNNFKEKIKSYIQQGGRIENLAHAIFKASAHASFFEKKVNLLRELFNSGVIKEDLLEEKNIFGETPIFYLRYLTPSSEISNRLKVLKAMGVNFYAINHRKEFLLLDLYRMKANLSLEKYEDEESEGEHPFDCFIKIAIESQQLSLLLGSLFSYVPQENDPHDVVFVIYEKLKKYVDEFQYSVITQNYMQYIFCTQHVVEKCLDSFKSIIHNFSDIEHLIKLFDRIKEEKKPGIDKIKNLIKKEALRLANEDNLLLDREDLYRHIFKEKTLNKVALFLKNKHNFSSEFEKILKELRQVQRTEEAQSKSGARSSIELKIR